MNRLLFAAARGASIERNYQMYKYDYWWEFTGALPVSDNYRFDEYQYRIYSDDEHLQYGPISIALRERVMFGPFKSKDYDLAWRYFKDRFNDYYKIPDEDLLMTLLIAAEFFADEGL